MFIMPNMESEKLTQQANPRERLAATFAKLKPGQRASVARALLKDLFETQKEAVDWFGQRGLELYPFWEHDQSPSVPVIRPIDRRPFLAD